MASLSILCRLLEARVLELEDEHKGTGSLEADEALLAAHDASVSTAAVVGGEGGGRLPYRTWCAVVYRAGQKRTVRLNLVGCRKELQVVLALMDEVADAQRKQVQPQP
jgi:hypothetical protein